MIESYLGILADAVTRSVEKDGPHLIEIAKTLGRKCGHSKFSGNLLYRPETLDKNV
jgi:TPP-dependent pyruvate/acetoin dehydrogenase alpha subunit